MLPLAMATPSAPKVNVRFESRKQLDRIKRAASILGYSLNTFAIRQLSASAEEVIQRDRDYPRSAVPVLTQATN